MARVTTFFIITGQNVRVLPVEHFQKSAVFLLVLQVPRLGVCTFDIVGVVYSLFLNLSIFYSYCVCRIHICLGMGYL